MNPSSKIYLLGYSTKGYYQRHRELNKSAKNFGISKIISFHDTDLEKTDFYKTNKKIFEIQRGAGLWLWKPYYIYETLMKLKDGDLLFYVDAASIFINSPGPLFEIAHKSKSGVITFDKRPLTNKMYCKRDVFINLSCDSEKFWNSYQSIATMLLFKKTEFSVFFVKNWLESCLNPYNLVNDRFSDDFKSLYPPLESFIDHREDQSILSVLVAKYNLETYRSPVVWGNYLKTLPFRHLGEHVCFPYDYMKQVEYSDQPMQNSPYDTIFIINRGKDLTLKEKGFKWKTNIERLLFRILMKLKQIVLK